MPRIVSVDVDLIERPAVVPAYAWRRGLLGSHGPRTTGVFRVTTDDGAVGMAYHEWSGPMLADITDRVLRPQLVGERADRREWIWHRLWELDRTEEFPIWLLGVVDVALWDLEARTLGVPVHRHHHLLHRRGVSRRCRPVPRAGVSRDQAARVGRSPGRC
jgi:L-alanine-DL-glutamate epimerase-like enolase superfamily enzyme